MGKIATLNIGGIPLMLTGNDSVVHVMSLPGMGVFHSTGKADDTVGIHFDTDLPMPDCRWLHRFDIADRTAECRFGIDGEGVYHYTFGDEGRLRFDPRRPDQVWLSPISNPDLLRFALWSAYAMAGLWRGAVPVHASTVVCHNRAVLCLGESGTGKSTHTSLWIKYIEGSSLLNDDSPILRVEGDEVNIYGSPWSGKTPCFKREHVPVAALLRLEQRPENSIRRLGIVEAFTALHPSCPPALAHDEHCTDRMVDFIGRVLSRVPVFRLGCLPDEGAARLAYNTIMECR